MRRVAGDEGAAVAELVCDQPASDPILPGDDVLAEIRTDAEDGADAGVAVDLFEIRLVRL